MKYPVTVMGRLVMLLFMTASLDAATLVETEDHQQAVYRMWVEGSKMRVETGRRGEYVLADYVRKKILIIDPARKEMIDVSEFVTSDSGQSKGLNVRVRHMGSGPSIAGYPTQKYTLSVNGRTCNTTMVSARALKDTQLEPLLESMAQMDFNPLGSQFMNECNRASLVFARRLKTLGLPLATMGENGQLRDKVRRIVRNSSPPAGGFSVPGGYRVVSMQQKMLEALGGVLSPGAAGQVNPDLQKMMQDLMRQQQP